MSEIIERVASCIKGGSVFSQEDRLEMARAAIEAMREPISDMMLDLEDGVRELESDAAANDPYVLANKACNECYDPKISTWFDVRDIIARAILAENERCAKIAERSGCWIAEKSAGMYSPPNGSPVVWVGLDGQGIAEAIRRR